MIPSISQMLTVAASNAAKSEEAIRKETQRRMVVRHKQTRVLGKNNTAKRKENDLVVMRVLERADGWLSSKEVVERIDDLAPNTVYAVLERLDGVKKETRKVGQYKTNFWRIEE